MHPVRKTMSKYVHTQKKIAGKNSQINVVVKFKQVNRMLFSVIIYLLLLLFNKIK